MGATTDYLATLKIQLDAAALAKKAALDIAYERATNVQFDKEGKMSTRKTAAGNDAGPGTLDVQYAEQQRNIGSANESSGMLKSGEYARDLATSQAGYRSTISNLNADRVSGQTAIDTDLASEYAKYQAMYGKPTPDANPTTGSGGTSGTNGSSGSSGAGGTQKPADPIDKPPAIVAPPTFTPAPKANIIPASTYTNMTPKQKAAVTARNKVPGGMGASAPKPVVPKKPVVTPPKKLKGPWDR
jgi:hypothetical protein